VIIDVHSHPYDPESFAARTAPPSKSPEHTMLNGQQEADYWGTGMTVQQMVVELDEAGIDKACILITERTRTQGGGRVSNEALYERYLQPYPDRFLGFAGCDPVADDGTFNQHGLTVYRRAIQELGFTGMKLLPAYLFLSPADPVFYPYYALAVELDTPIIMHQGMTLARTARVELSRPGLLDKVLIDFPTLRISVAHLGEPWEEELLGLMVKHQNLYADISFLCALGWQRLARDLASARALGVLSRVMFGTDTNCRPARYFVQWIKTGLNETLERQGYEPLTPEQITGILGQNAARFLKLH
jgi:hypothetical protein